jgi:hypothetical protein
MLDTLPENNYTTKKSNEEDDSMSTTDSDHIALLIGPQGTSIGRRSPRVSRIPCKSGQLFSHFLKEYTVFF